MPQTPSAKISYELSWSSIFRILSVALVIYLFFLFSNLLLLLLTVIVLAISLSPLVEKLKTILKIPRIWAIVIIYVVISIIIVLAVYTIIPPTITQVHNLYQTLPEYIKKSLPFLQSTANYSNQSTGSTNGFVGSVGNVFGGIFNLIFILILTFLLLIEKGGVINYLISLVPIREKAYVIEISKKIAFKIGAWFSGQILIMAIVGLVNFLAFWAVGIPYALTLGVLAFIFESVPNVGPILAAIPAMVLAYIDAPWKAVYVAVFATILHLVSNQFLVPKIMGKILNISAFVIILGLIIGGELAGITGMIIALPVIAAIQVVTQEWPNIKAKESFRWQKR